MLGIFGIGPLELAILFVVGLCCAGTVAALVVVAVLVARKKNGK